MIELTNHSQNERFYLHPEISEDLHLSVHTVNYLDLVRQYDKESQTSKAFQGQKDILRAKQQTVIASDRRYISELINRWLELMNVLCSVLSIALCFLPFPPSLVSKDFDAGFLSMSEGSNRDVGSAVKPSTTYRKPNH